MSRSRAIAAEVRAAAAHCIINDVPPGVARFMTSPLVAVVNLFLPFYICVSLFFLSSISLYLYSVLRSVYSLVCVPLACFDVCWLTEHATIRRVKYGISRRDSRRTGTFSRTQSNELTQLSVRTFNVRSFSGDQVPGIGRTTNDRLTDDQFRRYPTAAFCFLLCR